MALVHPDPSRVWGPDISHWDGHVDLSTTKARGGSFVFMKALDGAVLTRNYEENRRRAVEANLMHGPYQWLYRNANVSCRSQASAMRFLLDELPSNLPPVIDFEWTRYGGSMANPTYADLDMYVSDLLSFGVRKPILYSAAGYMNSFGQIPASLRQKFSAFWFANYNVSSPFLPYGFTRWDFWQFTGSGDALTYAPNDSGKLELDLNYFNGTVDDLYNLADGVVPPPTGDDMKQYKIVWSGGVARRTAPTTTGSSTGLPAYQYNQVVDVLEDGIPDQSYPTDVNKRWVKFADGYYGASNYPDGGGPKVRMIDVTSTPPPPAPGVPYTVTVSLDGYKTVTVTGTLEPL